MIDYIITLLASVIAILFVLVPHEYAHAFAAYKNGVGLRNLRADSL